MKKQRAKSKPPLPKGSPPSHVIEKLKKNPAQQKNLVLPPTETPKTGARKKYKARKLWNNNPPAPAAPPPSKAKTRGRLIKKGEGNKARVKEWSNIRLRF